MGLLLALSLLAMGCQTTPQVAEFKKYENEAAVPRISVEEAKKEVDAGNAVIVDSRAESAFKTERIAGSINVENDTKFDSMPKGKKLIVYCS